MKTLILFIMATTSLSLATYSQRPVDETSNLFKVMQMVKMDENDKYTINEAIQLRMEAVALLEEAKKLNDEWSELKKVTAMMHKFDDLKKQAEKKSEKTECKILVLQSDALELYELYNDILFAFYSNQHKRIFPDVSKNKISEANKQMKEASVLWQNAKMTREKGLKTGICRKSVEILISAQKMEEECIALQEEALSKLLGFNASETTHIPYAMFELNTNINPEFKNNNSTLVAENSDNINGETIQIAEVTKSTADDDDCIDHNVKQITYRIQIGAFMGKANEAAFRGITPISVEKSEHGFTRYLAGEYNSFDVAQHALEILQNTGFGDAFIVTYADSLRLGPGIKIPEREFARNK
jgi:hypothetical protein